MSHGHRPPRRGPVRASVLLAAVAVIVGVALAAAMRPALRAQTARLQFPDVGNEPVYIESAAADAGFADGHHRSARTARSLAPDGQVGHGRASIEVSNPADGEAAVDVRAYHPTDGGELYAASRRIAARSAGALDLVALLSAETAGRFGLELTADQPIAALARSRWTSGASAAYRAPVAAREVVLPLFSAHPDGTSSLLFAQNGGDDVSIELSVHDPQTGGIGTTTQSTLGRQQVMVWDAATDTTLFGPQHLAPNAGGGFVGPARLSAGRPIAVVGVLDVGGPASAAVEAQGVGEARTTLALPRLRAAADGGSLVAVANPGAQRAAATAVLTPLDGPPTTVAFDVPAYGAAYLDLTGASRGPAPVAGLPGDGFVGSAVITANRPLLATVAEEWRADGAVERLAAYNAFGPEDLGRHWDVPVVRRAIDFVSTELVIHNPGGAAVEARIVAAIAGETAAVEVSRSVAAGGVWSFDFGVLDDVRIGLGSATVQATSPVAVLIHERRDDQRTYPVPAVTMVIDKEFGSEMTANATLRQDGDDVVVTIQQTAGDNVSYSAYIQAAACDDDDAPAKHHLADVAGGRATTRLSRLDLRSIADGRHAIRVRRGRWRAACGIIPELRGLESADHSLVAALPAAAPAAAATATAAASATAGLPAPTPTTSPAAATATTEPANPSPTTAPPPTDAPGGGARLWLPVAHRGL